MTHAPETGARNRRHKFDARQILERVSRLAYVWRQIFTGAIPPDLSLPHSPDVNAVVGRLPAASVSVTASACTALTNSILEQPLVRVWHGIDQTIIDNATDEWHG